MNTSQGEQKIINILKKEGVNFQREFTPLDLKSLRGKRLRFDFFLEDKNTIIEFDGEQHFFFNKKFHQNQQGFQYYQESDAIKNEYCLAKKILLYRIPFFKLEQLDKYENLFINSFLVKTRWHNYNLTKELAKSYK